jgi:hypothetical protein
VESCRHGDPAAFKPDQKNAFDAAASVQAVLIPNAAHDLATRDSRRR